MSKIMDLVAEVEGIDDLKPTYNREFFDHVQKSDEERMRKQLVERAKRFIGVDDWLYARAEWATEWDDEGHHNFTISNLEHLADVAATDLVDSYIEDEHFDMSDEQYSKTIDWLGDQLVEMWDGKRKVLANRRVEEEKEYWAEFQSYNNLTLPKE